MKNFKTLLIILIITGASFTGKSYANSGAQLSEKIEEAVKFKKGALSLEENNVDFVKVSFRIMKDGKLEILALNYSDEKVKTQLISKLSQITIIDNQDFDKVYNYNFSFKTV